MTDRFVGIDGLTRAPDVAVVIDVMRAFTTAAWAFAGGAEKIVLAGSLDEARALKACHPGWLAVKDGPPAPGFDAVNSPALVRSLGLSGRTLVQKTTYGTVGALAARGAGLLLCASFPVAAATAREIAAYVGGDVAYVITGDGGRAQEDRACARYIAGLAAGRARGAGGYLRRAEASRSAERLAEGVRRGHRGIHPDDAALCLEADRFPFAMTAAVEDSGLTLRTTARPA